MTLARRSLRALTYVVTGVLSGAVTLLWLPVALVAGAVIATPALTLPLVAVERRRVVLLGHPPLADPHRRPGRPGARAWLRSRRAEPATWRELAYLVLHGTVLLTLDAVAVALAGAPVLLLGFGVLTRPGPGGVPVDGVDVAVGVAVALTAALAVLLLAAIVLGLVPLAAAAHGALARMLLAPGAEASRARLVDAFEVERRRIERDLHDGAQQQLLALGVTLVAAELELDGGPEAARALVRRAAEQSRSALAELRELINGIHPRVLTDLGLAAAVAELADRSGIPVEVALDLPHRLPSAVESTAYFVVAEAVANAVKHAGAARIAVAGGVRAGRLVVEVRDDGAGGADPAGGTGLTGLADRVDALDGTLRVWSPAGGGTRVRAELPCG